MRIRNQTSRPPGSHRASNRRPARSAPCGCARARGRRSTGTEANPLTGLPEFKIPEPLQINQNELCLALERAVLAGGKTGSAARKLLQVLQPHLLKEETDFLQPLGLLVGLSRGQITDSMRQIPARTEHLKARMFEIVREHAAIIEAARRLLQAARAEHKLALAAFTERLMLRAWTDELVFYPAAILIGEYLKLRFVEPASGGEP